MCTECASLGFAARTSFQKLSPKCENAKNEAFLSLDIEFSGMLQHCGLIFLCFPGRILPSLGAPGVVSFQLGRPSSLHVRRM